MGQSNAQRTDREQAQTPTSAWIEFAARGGSYVGTGRGGRAWRISATSTGWRLDFRDPGDESPTYAGTHASLWAAQREANWVHQPGRRAIPRQRQR
ncbi:hypothetical protein BH10ACT10_BH10ACT10_21780 [soil metagenome]